MITQERPDVGNPSEVVATYVDDNGATVEIDHLGIGNEHQYGEFAVYRGGVMIAEFATESAGYLPAYRPPLPSTDELVAMARQAVADWTEES